MVMRNYYEKSKSFLLLEILLNVLITIVIVLTLSSSIYGEWPPEGLQINPEGSMVTNRWGVVPDSTGGAYFGWYHSGVPSYCMVQRIDNEGNFLWEGAGISPADPDSQYYSAFIDMLSAPGGCVYITYNGIAPGESNNIMVQKLSPEGERLWGARGVFMTDSYLTEHYQGSFEKNLLVSDGAGGLIQGYNCVNYPPAGASLHAARVDSSGAQVWTDVSVFDYQVYDYGYFLMKQAVSDNAGGAIFVCEGDDRAEHGEGIFAQRISADGESLWPDLNRIFYFEGITSIDNWLTLSSWEPGELMMIVNLSLYNAGEEFYLQHIDQHGEETLTEFGQLITSLDQQSSSAGFDDLAVQNGFLYAPFHDTGIRRLYKLDEIGNQYYDEEGLCFDEREDSSGTQKINIFVRNNRITLMFGSLTYPGRYFTAAQAIDTLGTFLWDSYPREINEWGGHNQLLHECKACEIGQDTFFVAWSRYSDILGTILYPDGTSGSYPDNVVEDTDYVTLLPQDINILNTYPNPFNHEVTIVYQLKNPGTISFNAYSILGELISNEIVSELERGIHIWKWKPNKISSGVYFISLISKRDNRGAVKKIVLLK